MSMKASTECIDKMINVLKRANSDLGNMSSILSKNNGDEWDDAKAQEFNKIVQSVARCLDAPRGDLQAAIPKLESLKASIEAYSSVSLS